MAKTSTKKTTTNEEVKIEETEETVVIEESKKTKKAKDTNDDNKVKELEALLKQAQETISILQATASQEILKKEDKIDDEDLIEVISQRIGSLSISTKGYGQGVLYEFEEFGEIQDIPFGDLKEIVRSQKRFAENGYFYILNEKAVKQLRLENAYKKILTSKDMCELFDKKPESVIQMYNFATKSQKTSIIDMVVDRLTKGQFVDANILKGLSELSGKDLFKL